MNRVDLSELSVHQIFPAITIITDKGAQHVLTALGESVNKLKKEYPELEFHKKGAAQCIAATGALCPGSKLALFANRHGLRVYCVLPDVPDMNIVDTHFALGHIAATINRHERFWLITHEQEIVHVREGYVDKHCFNAVDAHECAPLTCHDAVFEKVLERYCESDPLPIICMGNTLLPHIQNNKRFGFLAVGAADSIDHAYLLAKKWYEKKRAEALHRAKNHPSGVITDGSVNHEQIAKAAQQGTIETLLVEKNYHKRGCEDLETAHLNIQKTCGLLARPVDLIDTIIETTVSKRGLVLFFEHAELGSYAPLSALVRF